MFPFSQEMRSDQAALISPASREGGGDFQGGRHPSGGLGGREHQAARWV